MTGKTKLIVIRWLIGLGLFGGGFVMLTAASDSSSVDKGHSNAVAQAGVALVALGLVIAGSILIGRDLAEWISTPVWRFITGIVFPDEHLDRPPVNYRLARRYREERRDDEAIEQYLNIIHHHPQELPAYLECIEVMIEAGDLEGAERVRATGLRKLRSAEARRELERAGVAGSLPAVPPRAN
jgi:hypothetical protein